MHTQSFHGNVSFNAHHSPMGAYATFTCGHFGTRGGLAAQLGKPAGQDLFIGVKLGGRYDRAPIRCLPFFDGARALIQEGALAYTLDKPDGQMDALSAYGAADIARHYGWGTDTWRTAEAAFSLYTPFGAIPDPAHATAEEVRAALLPAIVGEMLVDNRAGTQTKTVFLAMNFNEGGARILDAGLAGGRVGFALRGNYGIAAEAREIQGDAEGPAAVPAFNIMRWSVQQGLEDRSNPVHLLGSVPGVAVEVAAGKCVALRLALGCYVPGVVTTRLEGRYLYTRHYKNLEEVLNAGLERFDELRGRARALDQRLLASGLNRDQQFLIAHATRSYYGNTQLLEIEGDAGPEPYWIVNEGEYCMMNTLDLSVDQMFWELEHNPWVVRNLLDGFVKRYSYRDRVKVPTAGLEYPRAPGGISFAHDQGVHNQFSPFGQSSYELKDLTGCFSYMTHEQLCNWILMAGSYVAKTMDEKWIKSNLRTIEECGNSLLARDSKYPDKRIGIMRLDSSMTGNGSEITTYDSLDASLGQARNNVYMALKCWASYIAMGQFYFWISKIDKMHMWDEPAWRAAETIRTHLRSDRTLPAVFESVEVSSRILPAVEALIYPKNWDATDALKSFGRYADLLSALRTHTVSLLSDPQRRNHFADGGIKLSSTSDNSWLSKIAIVQHVARELFNLDENGGERAVRGPQGWERADAAHVRWLTEGESAYWAASDQIITGVAKGSRYYPRLITAALWLTAEQSRGK